MKWNWTAAQLGERHKVFCASMADVFDAEAPEGVRERLWKLIEATSNLDWLILTKRPENVLSMVPEAWRNRFPDNVWLGVSVEDQEAADTRIPLLARIPARIRFLSIEPMIGPVNLHISHQCCPCIEDGGSCDEDGHDLWRSYLHDGPPDWVIIGGESGTGARPLDIDWATDIYNQVKDEGVAWFWKQTGAVLAHRLGLKDRKGEDIEEVRRVLRGFDGQEIPWLKREFPEPEAA